MELSTRLEKLDFKFIIDNCKDERLWDKKWTIFEYDDIVINFEIISIDISNKKLRCRLNDANTYRCSVLSLPLSKDHYNEKVFNGLVSSGVLEIMTNKGRGLARETDEYARLSELDDEYNEQLENIAKEFLDDNGVTNKEIRDVYIDNYTSNNESYLASEYLSKQEPYFSARYKVTFLFFIGKDDKARDFAKRYLDKEVDLSLIQEEADEIRRTLDEEDFDYIKDELEEI